MKKNILLLINGFGVERADSYNVYSENLMPNLDKITKQRLFVSIPNKYLDYKSAYRNFSMGIDNPLTYSLVENNIANGEFDNNQLFKYILGETINKKSRLHIMVFWDSNKTVEHLMPILKTIQKYNISRVFIHIVLCQNSLDDYKEISRGLNSLNYEAGPNIKLGIVTGENNLYNMLNAKDLVKNFITEFGEKWKDLDKKVEVLIQTRTIPKDTRTFSVNPTYKFEENDQVLLFNYNNIDFTQFRKELYLQKYRQLNLDSVKFYSMFPVKADVQFPFMYNFAVSSNYTLDTLKKINATCIVMDKTNNCPYINYYLTGLRNTIDESLKYLLTDDGFIYDENKLLEAIKTYNKDLYIINYDIEDCKTLEEIQARLASIDKVIGAIYDYTIQNDVGLFITSLYGIDKTMYNKKQELVKINFSGKCPLIISDKDIYSTKYSVLEGSLYDLSNTIFTNINSQYKVQGILKKKSSLLSILYKKPKEEKKDAQANN